MLLPFDCFKPQHLLSSPKSVWAYVAVTFVRHHNWFDCRGHRGAPAFGTWGLPIVQILIHIELLDPPETRSSLEPIEFASPAAESQSCVPPWCATEEGALTPSEPASPEHEHHFLVRHHRTPRPHLGLGLHQAALDNAAGLTSSVGRILMLVADCEMRCWLSFAIHQRGPGPSLRLNCSILGFYWRESCRHWHTTQ